MPQYTIDIGAAANDGTGDPLRTAFNEVNLNFDQVFTAGPVLSNVRIANNTILTTTTNGNLILAPNGIGVVQSNVSIVPNTSNIRNLGSSTQRWSSLYVQYLDLSGALSVGDLTVAGNLTVTGNTIQIGNLVTDAKTIQLANTASTANAATGSGMTVGANDAIATFLFSSSANAWTTNLGLNVTGNIIPAANVTYSLGNSTNYWANLWVANNTIYIGGVALGMTAGNVLTVNGNAVLQNGSNSTISTTGNITAGNVLTGGIVSAVGNITGNYFIGNGSQLTGLAATYGNANVATFLAAYGSNTISTTGNITGNYFVGNGSLLTSLTGANVTGTVANATSATTAGTVTSNAQANITSVGTLTSLSSSGNITSGNLLTGGLISATGNITGNYIFGNGSQLTGILSSLPVSNGTSNINIATANGNVTVTSAGNTWTFGTDRTLTVPASNSVPGQISTQTTTQNESGFDLRITAGNTGGCTQPGGDLFLSAGVGYNGVSHGAGNVNIVTGDRYGNITGNIWNFGADGVLTLPLGSATIKNTAGNAVAFGLDAGLTSQGNAAVAIGIYSGVYSQSANAVAVGTLAGNGGRVTTNYVSGAVSPSTTLVVTSTTGIVPGMVITGTGFFGTITVVTVTNSTTLEISASAGFTPSGALNFTGSQGDNSVAIGTQAGQVQQGQFAVAIGDNAGNKAQGTDAVAIGASAGLNTQGAGAVAFGQGTGETSQGANAVALGKAAGQVNQGINSIAIGRSAGVADQGNNSIILNATGAVLDQTTANTFTVAPIRNDVANVAQVMFYNTTSKEITYGNTISVAGNVTAGNLSIGTITTTGNITFAGDSSSAPSLNNFNVNAVSITATAGNLAVINGGAGGESGGFISATRGISATGNVTGGNVLTGGLISATSTITSAANITGGNVLTGGLISATGTITSAANITGGNILTGGLISATGNVSGGNLNVTGNIIDTGALSIITGSNGNIALAPNGTGIVTVSSALSVTGNISANNLALAGNITSSIGFTGATITINNAPGGVEGAEVIWALPSPANTVLTTGLVQDVFQNGMRFFEAGGNSRGLYMDLGNVPNGAGTAVGYRDIPQVSFAANATIAATDAGRHYYSTSASNLTLTIANNTSVSWTVGTAITVVNRGSGNITVAQGTGVSLYLAGNSSAGNRTVSTYGMATLLNVAANVWMINGTGVS